MRPRFRLSRRHRAFCTGLVMFCLLFQQLAMAAYVCTLPAQPTATVMTGACAGMAMHTAASHAAMHGTDPRCADHCADHSSSAPDVRPPMVPPLLLPADWPVVAMTLTDRPDRVALPDPTLLPPDPPPTLRFCSLLI